MEVTNLGFAHFLAQADIVSKTLLVILVIMSLVSWSIIFLKALNMLLVGKKNRRFLDLFWNASSLVEVQEHINKIGEDNSFSVLTHKGIKAIDHYQLHPSSRLKDSGTLEEFLTRSIRTALDEERMKKENGLSALATIASTAPFVGLFGTVWGIYHALISISASGAGTIDKVAGPVGEALIMTGIGLAVAIPAAMAYNWVTRHNRVAMGALDAFAFELLTFLDSGRALNLRKS